MPSESIKELYVRNYGCINELTLRLTPLHALIGPNDSGKSTILRVLRTLVHFASDKFVRKDGVAVEPFRPYVEGLEGFTARVEFEDGLGYQLVSPQDRREKNRARVFESVAIKGRTSHSGERNPAGPSFLYTMEGSAAGAPEAKRLLSRLAGARLVRFDPDALRYSSMLIPDTESPFLENERGTGLPGVFDAVVNRDVEAFLAIQEKFRELFPTVRRLSLRNVSRDTKALEIQLTSGERVPAELMSEGMLLYLGFAAIPHIAPTSLLLVEEPENGLHPARIAEVLGILREVSKTTQVVIATHSPLVVNELEPDEVSVVTRRPEEGTKVTPIAETPNFEERSRVYALGELWLSYADGTFEEPLLVPSAGAIE